MRKQSWATVLCHARSAASGGSTGLGVVYALDAEIGTSEEVSGGEFVQPMAAALAGPDGERTLETQTSVSMTDMRRLAAAGLFLTALAGCSMAEIPARPVVETVQEEPPRESWRCEVPLRCYAIDPDTGKRTELLWSDTAWSQGWDTRSRACRSAHRFARNVECREGSPYFEQLEVDRECSCRLLE